MRKTVTISSTLIASIITLSACSTTSGVEDTPAQNSEQLQRWLLTPDDSGLVGVSADNDAAVDGQSIPLVVIPDAMHFDGDCGAALQLAENTDLSTVGSVARSFSREDIPVAAIALFSVEEPSNPTPGQIYSDIATACTEPLVDATSGVDYTITPLESDADGFIFTITAGPGNEGTNVIMLKDLGHHTILVAGQNNINESTVGELLGKQSEKLEDGLLSS